MRWKIARRGAMVTAAAGATLALAAGPALANETAYKSDGYRIVSIATYITNGDNLQACDKHPDGYSAVALLEIQGYSGQKTAWATRGSGTCATAYYNFVEGRYYEMRACIGDSGERRIVSCGAKVVGRT